MTNDTHIPHDDLTLYAMQCVSAEEGAAIGLHLKGCASCRAALAEISGDLSLVAMSVDIHPVPEGARERFLARLGDADSSAEKVVRMRPAAKSSRIRAAVWIPWAAAAALALIAAGLGIRLQFVSAELQHQTALAEAQAAENQRAHKVLELLTASSAQRVLLTAAPLQSVPSARAVYLASRGALILEASNLKAVDPGKTYELWLIPAHGEAPIPAGLFRPNPAGSASVVLPPIPEGVQAKAFGITVENAGGSETPTAPIVLSGAVPAAGD